MTPEEAYIYHLEQAANICEQQGWGDPFSYARSKEIYAAIRLGHKIADKYSGADAINKNGEEVEYKSTIAKNCKGAYTGISFQDTWEEQEKYLIEEKIAKYPEHYFNRFDGGRLVESWKMTGTDVCNILLPKIKKDYERKKALRASGYESADPRLSANICWTEIKKFGTQVI